MKKKRFGIAAWVAVVAASPCVHAADRSHRCAEQIDDAQRLACYDAQYGKPDKVASAGPSAAQAPALQAPVPDARPAVADSKAKAPKSAAQSGNLTASIRALSVFHDGRFKATLDNGEVWTQLEPDKAAVLAVGDSITLKKAMLGSFQLVTPRGVVTRVKQAQ